jgi:hypothetical protein
MSREPGGIYSDARRGFLHDQRDHAVRNRVSSPGAVAEGAENRAFGDACSFNPLAVGAHRARPRIAAVRNADHAAFALLVGLAGQPGPNRAYCTLRPRLTAISLKTQIAGSSQNVTLAGDSQV